MGGGTSRKKEERHRIGNKVALPRITRNQMGIRTGITGSRKGSEMIDNRIRAGTVRDIGRDQIDRKAERNGRQLAKKPSKPG